MKPFFHSLLVLIDGRRHFLIFPLNILYLFLLFLFKAVVHTNPSQNPFGLHGWICFKKTLKAAQQEADLKSCKSDSKPASCIDGLMFLPSFFQESLAFLPHTSAFSPLTCRFHIFDINPSKRPPGRSMPSSQRSPNAREMADLQDGT